MTPEQAAKLIDAANHVCIGLSLISTWLLALCVIQFLRLMRRQ